LLTLVPCRDVAGAFWAILAASWAPERSWASKAKNLMMRYLFRFKFPIDEAQAPGTHGGQALSQLFSAIQQVGTAVKANEIAAKDSVSILVFTDEKEAEKFKALAPIEYCFEIMPEFET
jgi:hypothetical protein